MSEPTVKSYSSKSKALRALTSIGVHAAAMSAKLLFQFGDEAKWSFYEEDAKAAQKVGEEAASEPQPQDSAPQEQSPVDQGQQQQQEAPADGEDQSATGAFGSMANNMVNTSAAPTQAPAARAASRSSYTIEKNRPEQNGITRPSAGGLCRAVWDACDDLRAQLATVPSSEQIRKMSDEKGWNKNNTMIEFYQWRKFNGITGRTPKATPAAPASEAAAPEGQAAAQEEHREEQPA